MHEPLAIRLEQVSKVYRLYGSQRDQLIDVLGLSRIGLHLGTPSKEFSALTDISLNVPRGHRIGIVGRNGAGKTTLLKLICGNFAPTSGEVEVNGTVQALLGLGLGFHPDYTGRENIEASLQYNGLSAREHDLAVDDIIDFCELGQFIDQPFKTYSLGMQARLMFATATAVKPDILIVDEVLGAGDAYFVAKSKIRVEKLVNSGCTMLLVSHSMQQVLELCNEAIWLDQGRIRMQGESFLVVKAYEEFVHGPISAIVQPEPVRIPGVGDPSAAPIPVAPGLLSIQNGESIARFRLDEVGLQEPHFIPHGTQGLLPRQLIPTSFEFVAPGGISRWDSVPGLKFCGFSVVTEQGVTNELMSMRPAKFVLGLIAETDGTFDCRYAVALYDYLGRCVAEIASPCDHFSCRRGDVRAIDLLFNPLQLGPGEYAVSLSVHEYGPLELYNTTPRFDLMNRSFIVKVDMPDSLRTIESLFFHSGEWAFHA